MNILRNVRRALGGARSGLVATHGRPDERGLRLRDAYLSGAVPPQLQPITAKIELLRREMAHSHAPLTWSRPWLTQSAELRDRLSLDGEGGDFTTTIPVSKAVQASKPEPACRSLMALTQVVGGSIAVEMGTNVGVSGAYIGAAVQMGGGGGV